MTMTVLQLERSSVVTFPRPAFRRRFDVFGYLRSDHAIAQLIRFAAVGGASNIAYVLLFMALYFEGSIAANLVGSIASTILANELHRRLTFHAHGRVGWMTAQWEGCGIAAVGLGVSTGALALMAFVLPGASSLLEAIMVVGVTAAVGLVRFLALRGLWFRKA